MSSSERVAASCDGSLYCEAETHIHGCFADFGKCDDPNEHRSAANRQDITWCWCGSGDPAPHTLPHDPWCPVVGRDALVDEIDRLRKQLGLPRPATPEGYLNA